MTTVETALSLHVDQLVDGPEEECCYCDQRARWLLATGPDPEPQPHCGEHAAQMIESNARVTRELG